MAKKLAIGLINDVVDPESQTDKESIREINFDSIDRYRSVTSHNVGVIFLQSRRYFYVMISTIGAIHCITKRTLTKTV